MNLKRFSFLITAVAVAALAVASSANGTSARGVNPVFRASSVGSHPNVIARLHTHDAALTSAESVPHQQATQMRVSPAAFSPATINPQFDGTETAAIADQQPFAQFHVLTYEQLGFQSGYYERADWNAPSGAIAFRYQGGIYPSAVQSIGAQNDFNNFLRSIGATPKACSTQSNIPNCSQDALANSTTNFFIVEWAIGNCLVETLATTPASLTSGPDFNQTQTTLTNVTNAAAQLANQFCNGSQQPTVPPQPTTRPQPTTPPPPTVGPQPTTPPPPSQSIDYTVVSVRAEKCPSQNPSACTSKFKPDFNLTKLPVTQVKAGKNVMLSIYWTPNKDLPNGLKPTYQWTVKLNGKPYDTYSFQGSQPSYPAGDQYWAGHVETLKQAGNYSVTGKVIVSNFVAQDSQKSLQAVAKQSQIKTLPPVSLTFNSLTVTNSAGKPQSTFRNGDTVKLIAHYTVANVRGGTAPEWVTVATGLPTGGTCKAIHKPATDRSDISNGPHTWSRSFQVSATTLVTFCTPVRIQVGKAAKQKVVNFTVA